MRLLGLDFETTGLDTSKDRITEMGAVVWDVDTKRPLTTLGFFLHDETYPPLSEEIIKITGLTDEILKEFGTPPAANLKWLDSYCKTHKIDYIVAHNGENYDRPLLYAELGRHNIAGECLRALPWIDTRTDIPFASEPDSRKLRHLALDCGFLNPIEHRAIFDVLTMLRVLSHYDLNAVLEYQKIPFITVRAIVSYDDRELAKKQRFSWEKIGDKTYPKWWVKKIKANKFDEEKKACTFPIVTVE
jgi:DNA polymerase-3 subunit epsilon